MHKDIIFSTHERYLKVLPQPFPALKSIPIEYKKLEAHAKNHEKGTFTVKKCIPFLDALTTGYIIPFPLDINCFYDGERMNFQLGATLPFEEINRFEVQGHNDNQAPKNLRHNKRTVEAIFKFQNPWFIKTPPGYSCIFTQPFNRNLPFKIIDGVVDTDEYPLQINFPFYWTTDSTERVLLQKNTPMVLVIPFKRNSWKMSVKKHDANKAYIQTLKWATFFEDIYKKITWKKKSYK